MYSDQMFLLLSAAVALIEMAAVCWVWERKMKQAEQRERTAEQRRKAAGAQLGQGRRKTLDNRGCH